jgi:hypothetical protein
MVTTRLATVANRSHTGILPLASAVAIRPWEQLPQSSASPRSSSPAASSAFSAEAKKNPYSALDIGVYSVHLDSPFGLMAGWVHTRPAFF